MKKLLFLIPVLLLLSCNAIKVRKDDLDYSLKLRGKIKQINMVNYRYSLRKNDTVVLKGSIVVFMNMENRIIRQLDSYSKFTDETNFTYENGLLKNTVNKSGNTVRKVDYKYDAHKNITDYISFENDTLTFHKTSVYDKNNNPIEETYFFPNDQSRNSVDRISYDYKNRTTITQNFDQNNKAKNHFFKTYFDKKGYVIKTESIATGDYKGITNSSVTAYDKMGNLLQSSTMDKDGKLNNSSEIKNTYDAKGNVILREKYMNGKLLEKTTYDIIYR